MIPHRICNLVLASEAPLPELQPATGQPPDFIFRLSNPDQWEQEGWEWFREWRGPGEDVWLSFFRRPSAYLLRFPDLADFRVSADGKDIQACPAPDTPPETLRHLLLDQVVPLVLGLSGRLVLHASAVAVEGRVIAFAGQSGSGKSTLAASFVQHGAALIADDCLLLEERDTGLAATASYPGLRLWPETAEALFSGTVPQSEVAHYTIKKRLDFGGACFDSLPEPRPLARLYFLQALDEEAGEACPAVVPLSRAEALMEITQYAYILETGEPARLRASFELSARAAAIPLFRRLRFVQDLAGLPRLRQCILGDISETAAGR
jgi:hypothetical protein